MTDRARTALWWTGLCSTIALLLLLGEGELSAPPIADPDRMRTWLGSRDPVAAAVAVLRVVVLVAASYLLLVSVLGWAARTTRSVRLVRLVDLGTLPAARRLLGGIAGVGLSASSAALAVTVPASATDGKGREESPLVIERVDEDEGTATMRVVPAAEAPTPPAPSAPAPWVTVAGDTMWAKAAAVLTDAWQRPPTDAEVVPFWQALIEMNRTRLADPANPDLLFVGQAFELPAPPPVP